MFHAFQVWIMNFLSDWIFFTNQKLFPNPFSFWNKKFFGFIKQSKVSIQRTGKFISNVIKDATLANHPSHKFDAFQISYQGEVRDLDESSIENVLNWDKVGVYPGV